MTGLEYLLIEVRDHLNDDMGSARKGLLAFRLQTSRRSCVDHKNILRRPLQKHQWRLQAF